MAVPQAGHRICVASMALDASVSIRPAMVHRAFISSVALTMHSGSTTSWSFTEGTFSSISRKLSSRSM